MLGLLSSEVRWKERANSFAKGESLSPLRTAPGQFFELHVWAWRDDPGERRFALKDASSLMKRNVQVFPGFKDFL
jgi:hypothetical protein